MILDFGCGDGRSWDANDDVVGIDINLHRLEVAKEKISVVQCDGRFLPFRSSVFSIEKHLVPSQRLTDFTRSFVKQPEFSIGKWLSRRLALTLVTIWDISKFPCAESRESRITFVTPCPSLLSEVNSETKTPRFLSR